MPGLKFSPEAVPPVDVFAPEQARFMLATPARMCACAALERWQPAIDSPVAVSQYAVEPSASTRHADMLVLPAQRPASPEMAESPSVTTVGVPTPGPSAAAGPAMARHARTPAMDTRPNARMRDLPRIGPPILCRVGADVKRRRSGRWRWRAPAAGRRRPPRAAPPPWPPGSRGARASPRLRSGRSPPWPADEVDLEL